MRTKDKDIIKRLVKRFRCDAVEISEAGYFGSGKDVNYNHKEEWFYPDNVFCYKFSDTRKAILNAYNNFRDKQKDMK